MIFRFIMAMAISFCLLPAHAQERPAPRVVDAPELENLATELPRALIASGRVKVGELDLRKFEAQINGLRWKVAPDVFFLGSGTDRSTAVNLREEKTVILSGPVLSRIDSKTLPSVLTHEAFGALGYDDEDYRKTLTLERLLTDSKEPEPFILDLDFKNMRLRTLNQRYESGGVTSVGGGGDDTAFELKQLCVKLTENSSDLKLRKAVWMIQVEPNWNPEVSETLISFDRKSKLFRVDLASVQWMIQSSMQNIAWKQVVAENVIQKIKKAQQ